MGGQCLHQYERSAFENFGGGLLTIKVVENKYILYFMGDVQTQIRKMCVTR